MTGDSWATARTRPPSPRRFIIPTAWRSGSPTPSGTASATSTIPRTRSCPTGDPNLAGSTAVCANYFIYGSASNAVANGSIQVTNQSFGLLTRSIRAYNSPDAATNDTVYNGQGFVTNAVQYTGTGDPDISYSLFYNERNELVREPMPGAASTLSPTMTWEAHWPRNL